jgi:hypothetical protein
MAPPTVRLRFGIGLLSSWWLSSCCFTNAARRQERPRSQIRGSIAHDAVRSMHQCVCVGLLAVEFHGVTKRPQQMLNHGQGHTVFIASTKQIFYFWAERRVIASSLRLAAQTVLRNGLDTEWSGPRILGTPAGPRRAAFWPCYFPLCSTQWSLLSSRAKSSHAV